MFLAACLIVVASLAILWAGRIARFVSDVTAILVYYFDKFFDR
jgi:hypothetical protein